MPSYISRRWAILRALKAPDAGDVDFGDCVEFTWSRQHGWIVDLANEREVWVAWLHRPGVRDLVEKRYLRKAAASPAFGPDVREP